MAVQVELKRIIITETSDQQVIFLKEVAGERTFPIVIESTEAFAIDRRLKGQPTPRPQTHELLWSVIEKLDGKLERILINDMTDHTFLRGSLYGATGKRSRSIRGPAMRSRSASPMMCRYSSPSMCWMRLEGEGNGGDVADFQK